MHGARNPTQGALWCSVLHTVAENVGALRLTLVRYSRDLGPLVDALVQPNQRCTGLKELGSIYTGSDVEG